MTLKRVYIENDSKWWSFNHLTRMDENLQNAHYYPSDLDFGCWGTLYGWNPKPAALLVNMHSRNPRVVKHFRSFVWDTRAGWFTLHNLTGIEKAFAIFCALLPCFYVSQREYVVAFYSTSFVALSEGLTLHSTIATTQCLLHDKCDAEMFRSSIDIHDEVFQPATENERGQERSFFLASITW